MTMMIEMFSKEETRMFGIAVLGVILISGFLLLCIEACVQLKNRRIRRLELQRAVREARKAARVKWKVSNSEFNQIANECIAKQTMKGFIMQTELCDVDVVKENDKKKCNGHGDCDTCHNTRCREYLVCDICGEEIDDRYIDINDEQYHTDCFIEKHEVSQ